MKRWKGVTVVVLVAAVVAMVGSLPGWAADAGQEDDAWTGAVETQKPKTGCITDPDQVAELNSSIFNHTEVCGSISSRGINTTVIKAIDGKLILTIGNACSGDADGQDAISACKAMKNFAYVTLFTDYMQKGNCYSSVLQTVNIVDALRKDVCPKGGKRKGKPKQTSTGDDVASEGGEVSEGNQTGPDTPETQDIPDDGGSGEGAGAGSFSNGDGCALVAGSGTSAAGALGFLLWLAPIALVGWRRRSS